MRGRTSCREAEYASTKSIFSQEKAIDDDLKVRTGLPKALCASLSFHFIIFLKNIFPMKL